MQTKLNENEKKKKKQAQGRMPLHKANTDPMHGKR
jgi:hypothetical protein